MGRLLAYKGRIALAIASVLAAGSAAVAGMAASAIIAEMGAPTSLVSVANNVATVPASAQSRAITYTYDAAGRLTGVNYGGGISITYAYDKAGNLLQRQAVSPTVVVTLEPGNPATMTLPSNWGQINLPSGLVTGTTTFTYTRMLNPTPGVGSFRFAGRSFNLVAAGASGYPATSFGGTFTITLQYADSDWQNAGIPDENSLNLYYWNGSAWVGGLPCGGCSLDTANNRLVVALNHLTEFALLGSLAPVEYRLFLPVTMRGYAGGW